METKIGDVVRVRGRDEPVEILSDPDPISGLVTVSPVYNGGVQEYYPDEFTPDQAY